MSVAHRQVRLDSEFLNRYSRGLFMGSRGRHEQRSTRGVRDRMTTYRRIDTSGLDRLIPFAFAVSLGIARLHAADHIVPRSGPASTVARPDVVFEPVGDEDSHRYLARGVGYAALITASEVTVLSSTTQTAGVFGGAARRTDRTSLRLRFHGAAPGAVVFGVDRSPGTTHYYRGGDASCWRVGVPNYSQVRVEAVYPGIDVVYYGHEGDLEFDFVIEPGADPARIELEILGADGLEVDDGGDVVIPTSNGSFRLRRPYVYQTVNGATQTIDGRYVAIGEESRRLRFELPDYDADHALVIDPMLGYARRFGGHATEATQDVAVDRDGNVYVTGWTQSTDFTAPAGERPELFGTGGDAEAFVMKLSADGSTVLYTTFLGGTKFDQALGIGVDDENNVYIAGTTSFLDSGFPVTEGAYRTTAADFFVSKLGPEGDVIYSTFFGGLNIASFGGLAVQGSGDSAHVAIVGTTVRGFPTTANAYRQALTAGAEAFLTIFEPGQPARGDQLVYSTVLGAASSGLDVAAGPNGTFYITGGAGPQFPLRHAFDTTFAGNREAFMAVFDPAQSGDDSLLYSTYIGGEKDENGTVEDGGIAVTPSGVALVVGTTTSFEFPVTPEGYRVSRQSADAFLVAIDPSLPGRDSLLYGTYFGGSGADAGTDVAVGPDSIAYVVGYTGSADMPGAGGEIAEKFGEGARGREQDAYFAKFDWNRVGNESLVDAAYLGGSSLDTAQGVAADSFETVYLAGVTSSNDAFEPGPTAGSSDGFVASIGTTIQLPSGVVGEPSTDALTAEFGVGPHSWALRSGALPSGLTLSADGTLSGIPEEIGEAVFALEITDSLAETRRKTYRKRIGRTGGFGEILLRKSAPTAVPGRQLPYRILVRNLTDQTFTNVGIVELLEPYFDFVSSVPPPTLREPKPGHVYWTIPRLDPHELEVITYTVRLPPDFPLGVGVEGTACLTEDDCNKKRDECYDFGNEFCDNHSCHGFFTTLDCITCRDAEKNICDDQWFDCVNAARGGTSQDLPEGTDGGCATDDQDTSAPIDPNEKNVASPPYVRSGEVLGYTIHFENIGDAEARDVFLTDVLDADLDLTTVQVARRFGGLEPLVPDTEVSIFDDDAERWTVTLDSATRTLSWELRNIDLPPTETDSVYFVVQAPEGLVSGTEIRNEATIQFEVFDPLTTNRTLNTIDEIPPVGTMDPLPETTSSPRFEISWTGADPVGEIERLFVFVSTNDGPFVPLLSTSQAASTTFEGEFGTSYAFFCVARDRAGNLEVSDEVAETTTTVVRDDASVLFHRGDPNASGTIDISDGILIFGHLFLGGPEELPCRESADANNDGAIDISDGISILGFLFLGREEPALPGPTDAPCGPDPDPRGSPGDLGCDAYAPCG